MSTLRENEGPSPQPQNRRQSVRTPPSWAVRVVCRRGGTGENVAVSLLDLSEDGACLMLCEAPKEGEEVSVCLTTPGSGAPLDRVGAVAWVVAVAEGTFCAGVRFLERLPYAVVPRYVQPDPRP